MEEEENPGGRCVMNMTDPEKYRSEGECKCVRCPSICLLHNIE